MSNFTVTVIYSSHNPEGRLPGTFPAQSLSPDKIQILPVSEDDLYHPHHRSLALLDRAEGEYTILLDEEDEFDSSFLERLVRSAFAPDIAFAMPLSHFKYIPEIDDYFTLFPDKDLRIDTHKDIPILPMELHGLMFRTERLKKVLSFIGNNPNHLKKGPASVNDNSNHPEKNSAFVNDSSNHPEKDAASANHRPEPEKEILLALLQEYPYFSFLASCTLQYAQARDYNHQYNVRVMTPQWYYEPLEQFLLPFLQNEYRRNGKVSLLSQRLALHMLHIRIFANLNNRNKHAIPKEEVPAYMELFSRILSFVEDETILSVQTNGTFAAPKNHLFDLRLKRNDFSYYPKLHCTDDALELTCKGTLFAHCSQLPVRINLIDYKNGCLEIDGCIDDLYSSERAALFADFDGKRFPVIWNRRYSMSKCFGVTYARMKTFHASVPITESKAPRLLNFMLCTVNGAHRLEYAFPSHTSRFSRDFTYAYWKFGSYLSWWDNEGIHIIRSSKLRVLNKELHLWKHMWSRKNGLFRDQVPLKILNFLLRPYFSRQKIWLFFDKIYKGGDSSEYIYRYAQDQNDGIKKYYLLDRNCSDYARLKKDGLKPLMRGSLKHRLIFLNADLVIASNSTVFAFNDYTFQRAIPIRGDVHFDVACVQHGMSVQKIAVAQQRLRDNTKLYFCASKYEIENLSKPAYDYEGYNALKLTGVPRYDGLKDRAEKIILLTPTWRMNSALPVSKNEGVARDYNPNFRETDYYRIYNSLINDPRLLKAAGNYGYRIRYVLHPIVSPQADDFTKNDLVEIVPSTGDMSYEKEFCEAALMVTDFSGVQFDFAYMRKPVVYLHHQDIPQHYEEGTFFYDTMGFGEICRTNEELIDVLCRYMETNCQMPEMYRKRADDFFAFSDHKNCERIYPIMLEHTLRKE